MRILLLTVLALTGLAPARTHHLSTTFYQASPRSLSACGPTRTPWRQVAVSRDLRRSLPCGTQVLVILQRRTGGRKTFRAVVWDVTGPRARRTVDVLVPRGEPALRYGRTTATVRVLGRQ